MIDGKGQMFAKGQMRSNMATSWSKLLLQLGVLGKYFAFEDGLNLTWHLKMCFGVFLGSGPFPGTTFGATSYLVFPPQTYFTIFEG